MIVLDKNTTALVCIEFQHEWLSEEGQLRKKLIKDELLFSSAIENAKHLIKLARENELHICHAGLSFQNDKEYLLFNGGHNRFGLAGAIPKAKTWLGNNANFFDPFLPREGEFVVQGRSGASVIKNSNLDAFLRHNGINTLILMGFALHICVESTLREAHDLGYSVYVATDACGVFESEQARYFQKHIIHHFGKSLPTAEFAYEMAS